MRVYDRIYLALECLFLASRTAQFHWLKESSDIPMGDNGWARDFCTIKVKGPRRSGHTSAIVKLVREHLRTVAFISPVPKQDGLANTKQFIHLNPGARTDWWGIDLRDVDAVVSDCASFLEESRHQGIPEDSIYERFMPTMLRRVNEKKPFYFIFVQ